MSLGADARLDATARIVLLASNGNNNLAATQVYTGWLYVPRLVCSGHTGKLCGLVWQHSCCSCGRRQGSSACGAILACPPSACIYWPCRTTNGSAIQLRQPTLVPADANTSCHGCGVDIAEHLCSSFPPDSWSLCKYTGVKLFVLNVMLLHIFMHCLANTAFASCL